MKVEIGVLIACLAVVFITAAVGSIFTSDRISSGWYDSVRPSITPPDFVFPIVWTMLYFLLAVSLYFAWTMEQDKRMVALLYGSNLALNSAWSLVFFGMKMPAIGVGVILLLWLSIAAIIWRFRKNRKASWTLVPYLLWVSFAAYLNCLVWLNTG